MHIDGDQVAIRRAAALGHFVPGFSFRILKGQDVLVEVGQDLGLAVHFLRGPCEFRWSVSQAMLGQNEPRLDGLLDSQSIGPLRVDWAMSPPDRLRPIGFREAKIHQNGLVEVVLTDGSNRWVFSTLVKPGTVGQIMEHLALDPPFCVAAEGIYDDALEITVVVISPTPGADARLAQDSATEVLSETMASELLVEAVGSAWS